MKNIELYEFFNIMGKNKERSMKVLFCNQNGLVLESDSIDDCAHILPDLILLDQPADSGYSPLIIFFNNGKYAGGYESGSQIVTSDRPKETQESNIFDFMREYNIAI